MGKQKRTNNKRDHKLYFASLFVGILADLFAIAEVLMYLSNSLNNANNTSNGIYIYDNINAITANYGSTVTFNTTNIVSKFSIFSGLIILALLIILMIGFLYKFKDIRKK